MSSAFRNFFLTLLLSLIVFGLVAWKLIPSVESALLGPADESVDVSDDASDSGDVSRDDNVSDLPPAENGEEVSCLFVGTNDDGRICSLIVTRVSEDRKIYLSSNISRPLMLRTAPMITGRGTPRFTIYLRAGTSDIFPPSYPGLSDLTSISALSRILPISER